MSNQKELGLAAGLLWEGAQERLDILEVRVTPETMAYLVHRFPEEVEEGDALSKPNDRAKNICLLGTRFTTDDGWNLGARIIPRKPSRFLQWCVAVDSWIARITKRNWRPRGV